jgi:hypothetical protein
MASKRKRKKPLPDWMGVLYDDKEKDKNTPECNKPMCPNTDAVDSKQACQSTSKTNTDNTSSIPGAEGNKKSCHNGASYWSTKSNSNPALSSKKGVPPETEPLSAEEIIRLSLPVLKFEGSLLYSYNSADSVHCTN